MNHAEFKAKLRILLADGEHDDEIVELLSRTTDVELATGLLVLCSDEDFEEDEDDDEEEDFEDEENFDEEEDDEDDEDEDEDGSEFDDGDLEDEVNRLDVERGSVW